MRQFRPTWYTLAAMKQFAIAPDGMLPETLIESLGPLETAGVDFLYLRPPSLHDSLERLLPEIVRSGISPLLPVDARPQESPPSLGIHFKSSQRDRLTDDLVLSGPLTTTSAHSPPEALEMLERGVGYVFVSPVFPPLSKPLSGPRGLFPRDGLTALVARFGERVVALGGITPIRVRELQESLEGDFSIAGITIYFNPDLHALKAGTRG